MRKFKHWLMAAAIAAGVISSPAAAVYAYTGDAAQTETPAAQENRGTVIPEQEVPAETENAPQETAEESGGETPFSIPGNGEVLDDKAEDGTKEFLTIQTKNGNTFFLVLDRSSNTENVYMLSMIDENDLAEFMDEPQAVDTPQVVIPETEPTEPDTGTGEDIGTDTGTEEDSNTTTSAIPEEGVDADAENNTDHDTAGG